jgi:Lrp/AsnC family leucine-responsive transcriptional regulator
MPGKARRSVDRTGTILIVLQAGGVVFMDEFDWKIVKALQNNARISLTDLSKTVHLSLPAVSTRLQKLQEKGYFASFSAILDPEKFGKEFTCFCLVQLGGHTSLHDETFKKFIAENQDILECYRITGEYEYLLKIITRSAKNMEKIRRKLQNIENVVNTNTLTVLDTLKEEFSIKPEE